MYIMPVVCTFQACDLQHTLRVKISRERVGEELDKMMGGKSAFFVESYSTKTPI